MCLVAQTCLKLLSKKTSLMNIEFTLLQLFQVKEDTCFQKDCRKENCH